jgi:hypothetical protein
MAMALREFFSHPISSIRQWAASHERFIAVNISWTLAAVFFIVSIIFLLKSLGIL